MLEQEQIHMKLTHFTVIASLYFHFEIYQIQSV